MTDENDTNDHNEVAMAKVSDVGAPSVVVDPSNAGGPPLVVESNTDVTPVATPIQQTNVVKNVGS